MTSESVVVMSANIEFVLSMTELLSQGQTNSGDPFRVVWSGNETSS
jgi:hypothetical protein